MNYANKLVQKEKNNIKMQHLALERNQSNLSYKISIVKEVLKQIPFDVNAIKTCLYHVFLNLNVILLFVHF